MALQSFFQKVAKIKIGHHFYYKKTFVTSTFCKRNFSWMHGFEDMNFLSQTVPFPYIIECTTSLCYRGGDCLGQKIHISKTMHPRKISLTESRGNKSFLLVKVVSDFDFGHFLEK